MIDVVLDASAAGKLIRNENHTQALRDYLTQAIDAGVRLLAPTVFDVEIRNLTARTARELGAPERLYPQYERIMELVETVTVEPADDYHVAVQQGITVQDAQYVDVAVRQAAMLVTYDKRQRNAAAAMNLPTRSPGIH